MSGWQSTNLKIGQRGIALTTSHKEGGEMYAVTFFYVCMKTVRIATAGKHAMGKPCVIGSTPQM